VFADQVMELQRKKN